MRASASTPAEVIWHDVECSRYAVDLPLWRELAAACGGPVLDVGAGTGRVSLDLAGRGHDVVALDLDAALLAELERRADGTAVETVVGDAAAFDLGGRRFPLVIAPMQTLQLLRAAGQRGFLASARRHVAPGGLCAVALAVDLEPFEAEQVVLPAPDRLIVDGVMYASQPLALRDRGATVAIERVRETLDGSGRRTAAGNTLELDRVTVAGVEAQARRAGFEPEPPRTIAETDEHIATVVVMLRG